MFQDKMNNQSASKVYSNQFLFTEGQADVVNMFIMPKGYVCIPKTPFSALQQNKTKVQPSQQELASNQLYSSVFRQDANSQKCVEWKGQMVEVIDTKNNIKKPKAPGQISVRKERKERKDSKRRKLEAQKLKEQEERKRQEEQEKRLDALRQKKEGPLTEYKAIQRVITSFFCHYLFEPLKNAKTTPKMSSLIQILQQKHTKKTTLSLLEQDFKRMFSVFINTSKQTHGMKKKVRELEYEIIEYIRRQQKKLNIDPDLIDNVTQTPSQSLQNFQQSIQSHSALFSVTKPQNQSSKPSKYRYSSRGRLVENVSSYTEDEKKLRPEQISKIGKTMCRIPKDKLQQFAIRFCPSGGQQHHRKAIYFNFDLTKMKTPVLRQIQAYLVELQMNGQLCPLDESDSSDQEFLIDC